MPSSAAAVPPYSAGTARPRATVGAPLAYWERAGLLVGDVLDYGCGREQHRWAKWDPAFHPYPAVLARRWDTVACSFVLNVLVDADAETAVATLARLLAPGGQSLVAVWRKGPVDTWSRAGFQSGRPVAAYAALLGRHFAGVERLPNVLGGDRPLWRCRAPRPTEETA